MSNEQQRVAVVTGASSGIGKATAEALVSRGWHVIGHGRDAERTKAAEADIRAAAAPGARVDMVRGDLSLMSDTVRMAEEIAALTDRIHVLVENAGGVRADRVVTPEGNEATFAGNHLGHFLLTQRLMPLLRKAASSSPPGTVRVLSTSSLAHVSRTGIDWDDLQQLDNWASVKAYSLAKLCNILFTRELARRVANDGIVAHAMHPGVVDTRFASYGDQTMQDYLAKMDMVTPEAGADTLIWLAVDPEPGGKTGGYFQDRKEIDPSEAAQDDALAARLWTESEALVAKALG